MQNLNLTQMLIKKRLWQGGVFSLLLMSGTAAYAGVSCTPNSGYPFNPTPEININMNTKPGETPSGTLLGTGDSGQFSWNCHFSRTGAQRTIWFINQTP